MNAAHSTPRPLHRLLAVLLAGCLALTGCSTIRDGGGHDDFSGELRIVAGSELADLEPLLAEAEDAIGVTVHMEYSGTIGGTEQLASGALDDKADAVWFPSNKYLSLVPDAQHKIARSEKVMASPVALGLRQSKAAELGWVSKQPSWEEITRAADEGKFTYAMTDPAHSNSGFSTVVSAASVLADTGASLTTGDVDGIADSLATFLRGQKATAGSSGWLADKFARGETRVDGMFNYESVLSTLDTSQLGEPLAVIVPSDGVVTADYPLSLLTSAPEDKKEAFDRLFEWLGSEEIQQRIATETGRRPLLAPGNDQDNKPVLVELPFPASVDVVKKLLRVYFDEARAPTQTVYVLDLSSSMGGGRLEQLKRALNNLAGMSQDTTTQLSSFRGREKVSFVPFDTEVRPQSTFELPANVDEQAMQPVRDYIGALQTGGATALYDAVLEAYRAATEQAQQNPEAFTTVVVLSDGEVNVGIDDDELISQIRALPGHENVPAYTVAFGEAQREELAHVAASLGGRSFDAGDSALPQIFEEIRGYQ